MTRARFDPLELESLKASVSLVGLFDRYGFKMRGRKIGFTLCPFHLERSASCKVDDNKGSFYCFGCGETGDHFDFLMHVAGLNFIEAVQSQGGVRKLSAPERNHLEKRRARIEAEEKAERDRQRVNIERRWATYLPIGGTHAAAYLEARGIPASPEWTFDLRFCPSLSYRGFVDDQASESVDLGEYPALVAAVRGPDMGLIGLHRTYLDRSRPSKLVPPGDLTRNKAKKVLGEQRGGLIWLSKPCARIGVGEGIETTRSWLVFSAEREPDTGIAAGVSLGNLSGRSTGSVPHPQNFKKRVSNGVPDLEQPGITWPAEVEEIVFLGDGDSDYVMTSARLMCALRRAHAQGKTVFRQFAPDGMDFNNLLQALAA
jgi:hypothetical protein